MPNIFDDIYSFYLNEECKDVNVFGWIYSGNSSSSNVLLRDLHSTLTQYTSTPYKYISGPAVSKIDVEDKDRLLEISFDMNEGISLQPYSANSSYVFVSDKAIMSILYDADVKNLYNAFIMLFQVLKSKTLNTIRVRYLDDNTTLSEVTLKNPGKIIPNPTLNQLIENAIYGLSTIPYDNLLEIRYVIYNTLVSAFNSLNITILNEILLYTCNDLLKTSSIPKKTYDALNFKLNQGILAMQNNNSLLKETFGIVNGLRVKFLKQDVTQNSHYVFDVLPNVNSSILRSYYSFLKNNQFIIEDTLTNEVYLIENDANIIDDKLFLKLTNFKGNPNSDYRIKYKNTKYYKAEYKNNKEELKFLHDQIEKNIIEQKNTKASYDVVDSSYRNIDYIAYVFYALFILIIVVLVFGNYMSIDENGKAIFCMLMLFLIIVLYVVYLIFYPGMEPFISSNVPTTVAELNTDFQNNNSMIYDEMIDSINNILLFTPIVSVNDMYLNIMKVMEKDMKKMSSADRRAAYDKNKTKINFNQKWFDIYKNIAFISALTMFSIVILVFYWLSTVNPNNMSMYMFLAIIASLFIIFYYFYFLSKHVRTHYRQYYFVKTNS